MSAVAEQQALTRAVLAGVRASRALQQQLLDLVRQLTDRPAAAYP